MDYISLAFIIFFVVFFTLYFVIKPKYRYIVIFAGSYFFYGYANPKMLLILMLVTLISYFGGIVIDNKKSKWTYCVFFLLEIAVLLVFKYTNFTIDNLNAVSSRIFSKQLIDVNWDILLPVGLSFMIFQACAYLSDIYRGRIDVEKNIIKYASFVAFFPTILSGPIQKARCLLPQIRAPKDFDSDQALKGTILFVWGVFEKVLVANNLNIIVSNVFDDYMNRSSMELMIGACCFSLYIYADFSSYSDMARGVAKVLNIDVGKNFDNPYLSKSTSEFWRRWHVSLNDWFIDNIYIPLGGNRKGTIRKYINVLVVFFVSGIWHGAQWHFVVWGVLNGLLVVIGQLLKPFKQKAYEKLGVSEKTESIVFIKRLGVFILITLTWVFFRTGVQEALIICKKILLFDFVSIFDPGILNIGGTAVATFLTVVFTCIFCIIQVKRQNEKESFIKFKSQPFLFQCILIAIIICVCIFGTLSTGANVDAEFLYYNF